MRYLVAIILSTVVTGAPAAFAQRNLPPLLLPVPEAPTPPPLFVPPPVPSVVTPLPSPSYGVPAGVTQAPLYGSGVTPTLRYRAPVKPRKIKRRPRVSDTLFFQTV